MLLDPINVGRFLVRTDLYLLIRFKSIACTEEKSMNQQISITLFLNMLSNVGLVCYYTSLPATKIFLLFSKETESLDGEGEGRNSIWLFLPSSLVSRGKATNCYAPFELVLHL